MKQFLLAEPAGSPPDPSTITPSSPDISPFLTPGTQQRIQWGITDIKDKYGGFVSDYYLYWKQAYLNVPVGILGAMTDVVAAVLTMFANLTVTLAVLLASPEGILGVVSDFYEKFLLGWLTPTARNILFWVLITFTIVLLIINAVRTIFKDKNTSATKLFTAIGGKAGAYALIMGSILVVIQNPFWILQKILGLGSGIINSIRGVPQEADLGLGGGMSELLRQHYQTINYGLPLPEDKDAYHAALMQNPDLKFDGADAWLTHSSPSGGSFILSLVFLIVWATLLVFVIIAAWKALVWGTTATTLIVFAPFSLIGIVWKNSGITEIGKGPKTPDKMYKDTWEGIRTYFLKFVTYISYYFVMILILSLGPQLIFEVAAVAMRNNSANALVSLLIVAISAGLIWFVRQINIGGKLFAGTRFETTLPGKNYKTDYRGYWADKYQKVPEKYRRKLYNTVNKGADSMTKAMNNSAISKTVEKAATGVAARYIPAAAPFVATGLHKAQSSITKRAKEAANIAYHGSIETPKLPSTSSTSTKPNKKTRTNKTSTSTVVKEKQAQKTAPKGTSTVPPAQPLTTTNKQQKTPTETSSKASTKTSKEATTRKKQAASTPAETTKQTMTRAPSPTPKKISKEEIKKAFTSQKITTPPAPEKTLPAPTQKQAENFYEQLHSTTPIIAAQYPNFTPTQIANETLKASQNKIYFRNPHLNPQYTIATEETRHRIQQMNPTQKPKVYTRTSPALLNQANYGGKTLYTPKFKTPRTSRIAQARARNKNMPTIAVTPPSRDFTTTLNSLPESLRTNPQRKKGETQ